MFPERAWKLLASSPPHHSLVLCVSSLWLFLSSTLYKKLVKVCKMSSWVLWVILEFIKPKDGGVGTSNLLLVSQKSRYLGTWDWSLKWGQISETEPFKSWGLTLTPGSELHWTVGHPGGAWRIRELVSGVGNWPVAFLREQHKYGPQKTQTSSDKSVQ